MTLSALIMLGVWLLIFGGGLVTCVTIAVRQSRRRKAKRSRSADNDRNRQKHSN